MSEPKLPRCDAAIVERISQITGFRREEARISYQATVAAIRERIEAGEEALMPGVGRFVFMMAKPRVIPAHGRLPQLKLEERPVLKFRTNIEFKEFLKSVKPKNPRRHQRWSDARKAATLANQILKSERIASPSNPQGMEPSAGSAPAHSNHTHAPSLDTAGTSSTSDCTPDSTGISPGAPSALPSEPPHAIESAPAQCEAELQSSATVTAPPAEAP